MRRLAHRLRWRKTFAKSPPASSEHKNHINYNCYIFLTKHFDKKLKLIVIITTRFLYSDLFGGERQKLFFTSAARQPTGAWTRIKLYIAA